MSHTFTAGQDNYLKKGVMIQKEILPVDYALLKSLIKTIKKIYFVISIIIALVMFTLGSEYIKGITEGFINQEEILLSWNIYVISIVLDFYFFTIHHC